MGQHDRAGDDGSDPEQCHGGGPTNEAAVDATVEGDDVVLSAYLRDDEEEQDGEGRHLQATGRPGRPPTDEHEHDRGEQGLVGGAAVVPGVEARGPRLDRSEPPAEEFVGAGESSDRPGVVPLRHREEHGAANQEDGGHQQGEARVHAPGPSTPAPSDLGEHREPQAADDDRDRDRDEDEPVGEKTRQVAAEQCEAGVVERRDGVEDAMPRGRTPSLVVRHPEADGQHRRDDRLHDDGDEEDPAQHATQVTQADTPGLGCGAQAGPQAHPARQENGDQRGQRHDAEAARLDEHEDDCLPGAAPVGRRVDRGQPGDADGARRREQCRHERCPILARPRDREHQEQRAHDGRSEKREDQHLPGVPQPRVAGLRRYAREHHRSRMSEAMPGSGRVPASHRRQPSWTDSSPPAATGVRGGAVPPCGDSPRRAARTR